MPAIPSMEQVPIGAVSWAQNICCSDTNAPLPGSNSFTKGQAKSRFEANGCRVRTQEGRQWRLSGQGDSWRPGGVSLDCRGNITRN